MKSTRRSAAVDAVAEDAIEAASRKAQKDRRATKAKPAPARAAVGDTAAEIAAAEVESLAAAASTAAASKEKPPPPLTSPAKPAPVRNIEETVATERQRVMEQNRREKEEQEREDERKRLADENQKLKQLLRKKSIPQRDESESSKTPKRPRRSNAQSREKRVKAFFVMWGLSVNI